MKDILIVVDMQRGAVRSPYAWGVVEPIRELLRSKIFDVVVATRFSNCENSIYEGLVDFNELKHSVDIDLILDVGELSDVIVDKTIYSCVNDSFMHKLSILNNGEYPKQVYICGINTEAAVLKIAADMFERYVRPVVLTSYCASNNGAESGYAGIMCMHSLIGESQLYEGLITDKSTLKVI